MTETMKEHKKTAIRQAVKKVLAYMAEQVVKENQEESTEIAEFKVEDEGIGFNKIPLKMEDLETAPAKMDDMRAEVQDPLEEINLGIVKQPRPTYISSLPTKELRAEIIELLKEFIDCFAWNYHEMPSLDRRLVEHRLSVKEGFRPFKQPPCRTAIEVMLKVKKEIKRLLKARFIQPIKYAK